MLTADELKQALRKEVPVICDDYHGRIEYKCITAIIYKFDKKTRNISVTVRMLDKNGKTEVEAKPEYLTLKEAT